MSRIGNVMERQTLSAPLHVGKTLIFCEGKTEENYFAYFREAFEHNQKKYSQIVIRTIPSGGNAQTVLNTAEAFFTKDENRAAYADYTRYLTFDCDAPENINDVVRAALASPNDYRLLVTNEVFETWLVMHFLEPPRGFLKRQAYQAMAEHYGIPAYNSRAKANAGLLRGLIGNGESVLKAIRCAHGWEETWNLEDQDLTRDITLMNPFSTLPDLLEDVMAEFSQTIHE